MGIGSPVPDLDTADPVLASYRRRSRQAAKEGRLGSGAPPFVPFSQRSSGKRGLANRDQQVVTNLRGKHVVLLVQPGKLGFEFTYSLLQAAHL